MPPLSALRSGGKAGQVWGAPGRGVVRLIVMALLIAPAAAGAQSVAGRVTDRASGLPLPGMLVALVDSAGSSIASAMTDEGGRYQLLAPAAGTYRLRAAAIGFLSEVSPELRLAAGEVTSFPFVFGAQPRRLPAVRVVGKQRCMLAPEAGAAVALLWEEVRTALTATRLTAEDERYRFNLRQYLRELDLDTRAVRRSRSWEQIGLERQPYGSLPAESLAAHGYVRTTPDGTWYYAPDARTLLSEAFARTHCLVPAAPEPGTRGLVGLGFEPMAQRAVPDVRGVLWLDSRTSELQHLDFTYTGLPVNLRDHSFGGRIDFERLPSGAWIVSRWIIRMPKLERATRYRASALLELGSGPRLTPVTEEVVAAILERGGEVLARVPASDSLKTSAFASLDGSAYDSTTGVPLASAQVWLDTPNQAVPAGRTMTDSAGRFTLERIPAGHYVLSLTHPRLDTLGASLAPVSLSLRGGDAVSVSFSTPSAAAVARAFCPRAHTGGPPLVRGTVRRATGGPPVPGALVRARWDNDSQGTNGDPAPAGELVSVADEGGHYTLCGVPRGLPLRLRAGDARGAGDVLTLTLDSAAVTLVELLLPAEGSRQNGTAAVMGRVSGADARPIAGAEVRVLPAESVVLTQNDGTFSLGGLAAGRHLLEFRAIGYAPVRRMKVLRAEAADTIDVQFSRVAQVLDTVTTTAQSDPFRTGFQARRARSAGGHFITPEMIRSSGTRRISEVLASVPGARVRKAGQVSIVELTGRGARTLKGCPVAYVLDGMPYEPSASVGLDGEIGLDDVQAIEVYDAAATPARFSRLGASCGVVLLWTRDRSVEATAMDRDSTSAPTPIRKPGETGTKEPRKVDR